MVFHRSSRLGCLSSDELATINFISIFLGIWPESKSFDDHGYGPIPSRRKGTCQVGRSFTAENCNRKIIGARFYTAGIQPSKCTTTTGLGETRSHTAPVAAGSLVDNATLLGLGAGTGRGGAPRARLVIYKACWGNQGCSEASNLCPNSLLPQHTDTSLPGMRGGGGGGVAGGD